MQFKAKYIIKNIVVILLTAMFFSCANDVKEVNDFLAEKNLPVGVSEKLNHVYKDSGRIKNRLIAPLWHDFSNRLKHPYSEFPEGVKLVTIDSKGTDSTTVTGDYGISFSKTSISELIGNVVVFNHKEQTKLETEQLYWDQKTNYFFTEKKFRLTLEGDTINGIGFESNQNLTGWVLKRIKGDLEVKEE